MTYSNRFRFYSSIVGLIVVVTLLLITRAVVNAAFDPIHGAVPFDQLENPPKDALVLIQNHGNLDGGSSQIVSLDGTVVQKTPPALERGWYSIARFWNNEQFIIMSSNQDGATQSQWFTSKDGALQEVQLPDACSVVPKEKDFTDVYCGGVVSLSPDEQQVLLVGGYSNPYPADGQSESLYVLWNRSDNTSQVIQKADLPIDDAIKNDDAAYVSIEWEKNTPHTAFVIVQKEQEGVLTQLARFRYTLGDKKFESYSLTADYGPLMIPVNQEGGMMLDRDYIIDSTLPYTYKLTGQINPFAAHRVQMYKTATGETFSLMKWRRVFGYNSIYVYQVEQGDNPEWFIVRVDEQLFLTKRGSDQYSHITNLPYEGPDAMPTIMVDVFTPAQSQ
jgi:hypothetical protein